MTHTIHIIEDEVALRKALREKLTAEKFTVIESDDGQDGLLTALKKHPDIILLDIVMPKMDGMSLLRKLREDEWGKSVPVILLTNLNDPETVAEATSKGGYDFLVKADWSLEDVVEKIKDRLKIS